MMPDKLLSQMTEDELKAEMERLKQEGRKRYEAGELDDAMGLRSRWYLAASYLMDSTSILTGKEYFIEGEPGKTFTVTHVDGVMAHGTLSNNLFPAAYPIAMLTDEPPVD